MQREQVRYTRGLHELGEGAYAYLQPNGAWGLSNAGLVTSGGASLLVDTLFDLPSTRAMLDAMQPVTAGRIDTVVNTHANGDHCWGNQLVRNAEIISSRASANEMADLPPAQVARLLEAARLARRLGRLRGPVSRVLARARLQQLAGVAESADFVLRIFGAFQFEGIELVPPTRTFDQALTLQVGDKEVRLTELGPAHTRGDLIVHVPADRVVYTGDLLFMNAHPIIWDGPVANWIRACEHIEALDVDIVVPGHGPLTDRGAVARLRGYLEWLVEEGSKRFRAGLPLQQAALDMTLDDYRDWSESERLVLNLDAVYRGLDPSRERLDTVAAFAAMARYARKRG